MLNENIINRAIEMAKDEIDLTIAQKAHKLHEGKTLREICDVDIFNDESMCEDLLNYIAAAPYNMAHNIDETESDLEFEQAYAIYQFIMGRYAVWCDWAEQA